MTKFDTIKTLMMRYRQEEKGSMAIAYSVSLLTLVMSIGVAYDFSMMSNADKKAQSVADSAALAAAVFVAKNDRAPQSTDEGYMNHVEYDARAEGHRFADSVHKAGTGKPTVKISYDFINGKATATVEGKTSPAFLRVLGRTELAFKETSEVLFAEKGYKSPASVFVADVSGVFE